MGHTGVLEGAHDVDEPLQPGEVVEQLRAEAGAVVVALLQPGHVAIGDAGVGRLLGVEHAAEHVHPWVAHVDDGGQYVETAAHALAGGGIAQCEGVEDRSFA